MIIDASIERLLQYAQSHLLLDDLDVVYKRNVLLDLLGLKEYTVYEVEYDAIDAMETPDEVLSPIISYALEKGIIQPGQEEYFGNKVMDIVSLTPSGIVDIFDELHESSPAKAFDWLHDYCIKNDYIKASRIAKNKHWEAKSTKGKLEITINLSKPEKNNKDTAKLVGAKPSGYPACMICKENEGCANNLRQNLRTIPLEMGGEDWFWQFSPYAYFNQHGIAINGEHTPMKVDKSTVRKLLDFIDYAPSTYFIGCNAALPIVGGSILTHDHFQGGGKVLPMHKATALNKYKSEDYPYIETYVLDWYNSVIRLVSTNKNMLIEYAGDIIDAWKNYDDESVGIVHATDKQHNAVTPIARKCKDKNKNDAYCVELILRNNRTDEKYPDGIFHVHPEYQNIKSESIGLIEAMGLFILPARLDRQLKEVQEYLIGARKYDKKALAEDMQVHARMIEKLMKENPKCTPAEAPLIIKDEVNSVCEHILDNTAVFKKDEEGAAAFDRFLESVGIRR